LIYLSSGMQYAVLYGTLLILVIGAFFRFFNGTSDFSKNETSAYFLLLFMICIIGFRDWASPDFGDSIAYGKYFSLANTPKSVWYAKSKFFGYLYFYWHRLGWSPELFFVMSAIFYCAPMYALSKHFSFPANPYIFLLFFACSFGWYSFGVNGIRNGWAIAMLLWCFLAFYKQKNIITVACAIFAWCIHGSSMIAIGGMLAAFFYRKPDKAFLMWCACVVLSLTFGTVFQEYFATFNFVAQDGEGYLKTQKEFVPTDVEFSHTGFRWDFLLFSFVPILWGLICIKKLSKQGRIDLFYKFLLCTYIYANAIWVLAIRANYSNRLAQLSWWMIPIVMAYPFYRMDVFYNRKRVMSLVLVCYYGFTFFMYLIG